MNSSPLRRVATALIIMGALLAAACETGPRIRAEAAPGTDVARFTTFGFFDKVGTDQHGYTTIATAYLKEAVARELQARGLHEAANPDLLVNFFIQTRDKIESYPGTLGFGYSRFGWHGAWGAAYGAPDIRTYTEGTLTIDLVDRQKNALAWQGMAIGRLTEHALQQPAATVDSAVRAIFAKYPVQKAARADAGR